MKNKVVHLPVRKKTERDLLIQELEDTAARHAAGNRVIDELRREVAGLRVRVEAAERHADHVVKSFEATLNMVRGSR
jgi:hypothetical protein